MTSLSFRTDGEPVLVSAGGGHVALWDLEERKLRAQIRSAHSSDGAMAGARCLPGEPLLVTAGEDNTLKQVRREVDGRPFTV